MFKFIVRDIHGENIEVTDFYWFEENFFNSQEQSYRYKIIEILANDKTIWKS